VIFYRSPVCAALIFLAFPLQASTVKFIPTDRYLPALTTAASKAASSITCYMYVYSLYIGNDVDQPLRLAESLAAAAARGVDVEVILNGPSAWSAEEAQGALDDRNRAAAEFLARRGVRVFFETSPALLHAKVALIDQDVVLLGSTNWSRKAFAENIEANLLVRDAALSREIRTSLAAVPRQPYVVESSGAVRLPVSLLTAPDGIRLMSRRKDGTVFDVYAWLQKEAQAPGAPAVLKVDLDALAARLGKTSGTRGGRRLYVARNLRNLQDRYNLLSVAFHDGADAEVRLASVSGESVTLPRDYWAFGWDQRLSFPAKIMLLMDRYYSSRSPAPPRWSRSKYTLEDDHGVSESTLDRGTMELKRMDLLEVENAPLPVLGEARRPNEYTANPFYDFAERQARRNRLAEKYGRDKVDRAARIASDFYEDWDMDAIKALVLLENEFGPDKVSRAVQRVGDKRPDNPKRNIAYLITTIKNPDRPDQLVPSR
jgi:hypothetical protein